MRGKIIFLVFLFIFVGAGFACAEWYPGLIHIHSTFSDGELVPFAVKFEVKNAHNRFLFQTDHNDKIPNQTTLDRITKDYGFDNYRKEFDSTEGLIVFAGAELTSFFAGHGTHTLALGDIREDQELNDLQYKGGTQQAIINRINKMGLLSVAAHPNNTQYQYDLGHADNISGIEFFNENSKAYAKTLAWYVKNASRNIFVISGSDFHFIEDPTQVASVRLSRKTPIWVIKDLTKESILEAFRQGHTYATQNGFSFENFSFLPGFAWQETKKASISLTVKVNKKISRDINLLLYRVPKTEPVARIVLKKGKSKFDCTLVDPSLPKGKMTYIVVIDQQAITSPIRLDIKPPKPEKKIASVRTGSPLGRVPLMVGKSQLEAYRILKNPKYSNQSPGFSINMIPDGTLMARSNLVWNVTVSVDKDRKVIKSDWDLEAFISKFRYPVKDVLPEIFLDKKPIFTRALMHQNVIHLGFEINGRKYLVTVTSKNKLYHSENGGGLNPAKFYLDANWQNCFLSKFIEGGWGLFENQSTRDRIPAIKFEGMP